MNDETKQLLEMLFDEVERCYAASNTFTDETRDELMAGARLMRNDL